VVAFDDGEDEIEWLSKDQPNGTKELFKVVPPVVNDVGKSEKHDNNLKIDSSDFVESMVDSGEGV